MTDPSALAADAVNPSAANEFFTRVPNIAAREKFLVKLKGTKKEVENMQRTLANISFIEIAGTEIVPGGWFKEHWRLILGGIGGFGYIALCFYLGHKIGNQCRGIIVSGNELIEAFQEGKSTLIKWLQFLDSGKKMIEGNLTEEVVVEVFEEVLDKAVDILVRQPAWKLVDMAVEVSITRLLLGLPPFSEVF